MHRSSNITVTQGGNCDCHIFFFIRYFVYQTTRASALNPCIVKINSANFHPDCAIVLRNYSLLCEAIYNSYFNQQSMVSHDQYIADFISSRDVMYMGGFLLYKMRVNRAMPTHTARLQSAIMQSVHVHISINLMLIPVNAYLCSAMQKKHRGEKIPFPPTQTTETSCTHQLVHAHNTYTYTSIVGQADSRLTISCDLMVIPASLFLYCWMSPPWYWLALNFTVRTPTLALDLWPGSW